MNGRSVPQSGVGAEVPERGAIKRAQSVHAPVGAAEEDAILSYGRRM
jgi:hypothetical protein